jgi:hypothetical protein
MLQPNCKTKTADPSKLMDHALRFHHTVRFMRSKSTDATWVGVLALPAMVLSAFTSELFLKALVCLDTGSIPQGHHLDRLFRMLALDTRKAIKAGWDAYTPSQENTYRALEAELGRPIPRDLGSALRAGSRSFIELRYMYEGTPKSEFHILDLPEILHRVIIARRARIGRDGTRSRQRSRTFPTVDWASSECRTLPMCTLA